MDESVPWLHGVELPAGPDHVIVLYQPQDIGSELDPMSIFRGIAGDAATRAKAGLRILSMTTMPLRHGGTAFGDTGSGYETKVAVAVLYERWPGATS